MSTPVAIPVAELARWMGCDRAWVEGLVDRGELAAVRGRHGYVCDPRALDAWMRRARAAGPESSGDATAILDVSRALAAGEPPQSVCMRMLDRLLAALGAPAGAVFLHDEDAWLRLHAAHGVTEEDLPPGLEGAVVWAGANAEPLLLPDPRRAGAPEVEDETGRDVLAVPFVLEDRVLGVLGALRDLSSPPFGDGEVSVGSSLATELAFAFEHAQVQDYLSRRLHSVHEQLEVYAHDVRSSFTAEKARTRELLAALSELETTYRATVRSLAAAVEAKDEYTGGHLRRVTEFAEAILARVAPAEAEDAAFEFGFLLHDVGKLGVPDAILGKRGPLDDEELRIMRRHPEIGRSILEGIPFLDAARDVVYLHHERWDGTGYPLGLRGDEIPLGARVFAVADAFDAMTTDRPYRDALPLEEARARLRLGSGTQFWPPAVESFLAIPENDVLAVMSAAHPSAPMSEGEAR